MNWWNKATTFLKEVRAEMQKVSFPSRDEVINTSAVVVVASFIFGIYLYAAYIVITEVYRWVVEVLG